MNGRQLLPLSALFLCGVMNAQIDSLNVKQKDIDELVMTGTMKTVSKSQSPVPVEIYTPKFFENCIAVTTLFYKIFSKKSYPEFNRSSSDD